MEGGGHFGLTWKFTKNSFWQSLMDTKRSNCAKFQENLSSGFFTKMKWKEQQEQEQEQQEQQEQQSGPSYRALDFVGANKSENRF